MSIQISENIIKGPIIYQLTQLFGDQYTYYGEEIPENFKRPSFHVSRISDVSTKGYTGNEYRFRDDQYRYEIKYFTDKKININEDINDKIDILNFLRLEDKESAWDDGDVSDDIISKEIY